MSKSGGVDIEEDWTFAESAGHSWSWYFVDPSKLHACTNAAVLIREIMRRGANQSCAIRGIYPYVSLKGANPVDPLMPKLITNSTMGTFSIQSF